VSWLCSISPDSIDLIAFFYSGTFFPQGSFIPAVNQEPDHVNLSEKFIPIRKGLLEFVILKLIDADQLYVADMLERLSKTEFTTQEGTLYPLLSKMRREGLVDYEWRESDSGPPRKYYELTTRGRAQLAELGEYWKHLNATINRLGK